MKHSARLSTNRVIAIGFICIGVLIVLSLTVNIIQAINNYRLQDEKQIVTVPMLFNAPFAISQNQADASYLQQMALSFIALRLNVTPETVDASHALLLKMVKPASQNELKIIFAEESNKIKESNVNSGFFQTSVKVYPSLNRIDYRGELKTWIGNSEPETAIKSYSLFLDRTEGVTWLARFVEVKDEKKK